MFNGSEPRLQMPSRSVASLGRFVEVGFVDQLGSGTGKSFTFHDNTVAVFRIEGRVFAVDDFCVRCGSSLAAGTRVDFVIHCPRCEWHYDVVTGSVEAVPALRIDTFEAKIEDLRVLIRTTPKEHRSKR
jgi:nitrite reductase/ring-hydroxylating ferredoxin subunit